jgi:hypothetical protein
MEWYNPSTEPASKYYCIHQNYPLKLMQNTIEDDHKLKQLKTTKPALKKILTGIPHTEDEERQS